MLGRRSACAMADFKCRSLPTTPSPKPHVPHAVATLEVITARERQASRRRTRHERRKPTNFALHSLKKRG